MWKRQVFMHRTQIDHFPWLLDLHSMPNKCLGGKKCPFQINAEHQVIICFCDLPKRGVSFNAGVVDQNIQPTERFDGFGYHPLSVGHFADIPLDCHCSPPKFSNRLDRLFCGLWMRDIIDNEVSSFFREPQRDCLTNALIATRD